MWQIYNNVNCLKVEYNQVTILSFYLGVKAPIPSKVICIDIRFAYKKSLDLRRFTAAFSDSQQQKNILLVNKYVVTLMIFQEVRNVDIKAAYTVNKAV